MLTFWQLREANLKRCESPRPNGFQHPLSDWTPLQWAGAVSGEGGEVAEAMLNFLVPLANMFKSIGLATNAAKKVDRRLMHGDTVAAQLQHTALAEAQDVGKEIGDVLVYADLLAARVGLTLEECVRMAFNGKSEEIGSDIFI